MSSTSLSPATFRPPNRPGHFLLGILPEYRRDPLGIFIKAAREQGDIVQLRFGPYINYLISHPDYIQQVLQTNNRHYRHDPFSTDLLKLVSGLNLVTSDGDYWLRQRRLMQPAFHRQRIAGFGKIMTDTTLKKLKRWEVIAAGGQPLNICEEMMRLTMEIVGKALFNVDLSQETNVLGQAYKTMANYVEYRLNALFHVPLFMPTPRNRALKRAITDINQFLQDTIDERRQKGNQAHDLMAMLLEARDEETGKGMTDQQLRNELLAMIGAGYETTAAALPWMFYLLWQHPRVEQKLLAELEAVLGGSIPTIADLPNLTYLRQVSEEALRLYPPFWSLAVREAIAVERFGDYHLPAGSSVLIIPYALHRDPRFWDDPERFNPDRFAPERSTGRHPFVYIPFGGGPRKCIGNIFALTEMQLILATILQRYQLHLKPGYKVEPDTKFVLRIKDDLPMMVTPR